jgi:hypothetical protein
MRWRNLGPRPRNEGAHPSHLDHDGARVQPAPAAMSRPRLMCGALASLRCDSHSNAFFTTHFFLFAVAFLFASIASFPPRSLLPRDAKVTTRVRSGHNRVRPSIRCLCLLAYRCLRPRETIAHLGRCFNNRAEASRSNFSNHSQRTVHKKHPPLPSTAVLEHAPRSPSIATGIIKTVRESHAIAQYICCTSPRTSLSITSVFCTPPQTLWYTFCRRQIPPRQ